MTEAPASTRAARLMSATLAGGVLIAAGSALPWAAARFAGARVGGSGPLLGGGTASLSGGDLAPAVPALGLLTAVAALLALLARGRSRGVLVGVAAAAAAAAALAVVPALGQGRIEARAQERRAEGGYAGAASVARRPGVAVPLAGAVLAAAAGAAAVRPASRGAGVRMPRPADGADAADEHGEIW